METAKLRCARQNLCIGIGEHGICVLMSLGRSCIRVSRPAGSGGKLRHTTSIERRGALVTPV